MKRPLTTRSTPHRNAVLISAAAAIVLAAGLAGCGSTAVKSGLTVESEIAVPIREERISTQRPLVGITAADLYSWGPGATAQQLEFYDELERRDIVAHDDVFHATLLFARGSSAGTYRQRLELVRREGWVDERFSRPSREAVTIGETAQVLVRALGLTGGGSPDSAAATLRQVGLLPVEIPANQGLTGRQLLALLAGAHDALEAGALDGHAVARRHADAWLDPDPFTAPAGEEHFDELALLPTPTPTAPGPVPEPATEPAPAVVPDPVPAAAAAQEPAPPAPRVRTEPLPEIPLPEPEPTPTPPPAEPKEPAAPAAEPTPPPAPAEPAPAPAPPPEPAPKPSPWVPGKPLSGNR